MATHEEIKKAILNTAGNPVSGSLVALVDDMAQRIIDLDKPKTANEKPKPTETRVQKADEKRDVPHHTV
jgi:hypothetical protein